MKVNKILTPVDFSEYSINALRYAAEISRSSGAEIILVHVTNSNSLASTLKGNLNPSHLLNLLASENFLEGIKISKITRQGNVAEVILDEARQRDVDFIVMGTRGAGNVTRNLFGTTTTKVIGSSTCTVLAIPDEALFRPIRKIIIAVDLNSDNQKVIVEFIEVIKNTNASILIVYVGEDKEGEFKFNLDRLTSKLKSQTSYPKIVSKVIESPDFPKRLEDFAMNIEADMLVMLSHHRNIFESIFEPSHSKLLAFHSTIPLMVIQQRKVPVYFF